MLAGLEYFVNEVEGAGKKDTIENPESDNLLREIGIGEDIIYWYLHSA